MYHNGLCRTANGISQTDWEIIEESMHREVKAGTENRTVVARETTVQDTDKTTVIGTSALIRSILTIHLPALTQNGSHR